MLIYKNTCDNIFYILLYLNMEVQMDPTHRIHFLENYIEPVIYHPITQLAFRFAIEVVKIVAAKIFLEFLGKRFLNETSKMKPREVFIITVFAPVFEEILFRGILLRSIHAMQKVSNNQNGLTEEEAAQQKHRIHLSAFIFAAAHLTNPHKTMTSALMQFTWTYLGGLSYGYLSEKYNTLSVSILAHGFNNSLTVAIGMYPGHLAPFFLLAVVANKLGAYILATTTIAEFAVTEVRQAVVFCVGLPGRVMNWNIQETQVEVAVYEVYSLKEETDGVSLMRT